MEPLSSSCATGEHVGMQTRDPNETLLDVERTCNIKRCSQNILVSTLNVLASDPKGYRRSSIHYMQYLAWWSSRLICIKLILSYLSKTFSFENIDNQHTGVNQVSLSIIHYEYTGSNQVFIVPVKPTKF